jgi:hypothetical protein
MDATSVDDAALNPPGQAFATVTRPYAGLDCLGEIQIDGEPALVVWPQLGDAVAIDFKNDGHRYALVLSLDTDAPRLSVQPMVGRQISAENEPAVLGAVAAIWAEARVIV